MRRLLLGVAIGLLIANYGLFVVGALGAPWSDRIERMHRRRMGLILALVISALVLAACASHPVYICYPGTAIERGYKFDVNICEPQRDIAPGSIPITPPAAPQAPTA